MTLFKYLVLVAGCYLIWKILKSMKSTSPKPLSNKDKVDFNIDLDDKSNTFEGTLTFEDGQQSGIKGKIVGDRLDFTTSNDLIYNYYSGPQLEKILQAFFQFGKKSMTDFPMTEIPSPSHDLRNTKLSISATFTPDKEEKSKEKELSNDNSQ